MNHETNIALLIDADNSPAGKIEEILDELANYGVINIRRAYGNWKSPHLKDFGDGTIMLRAVPHPAYAPDWLAVPWETKGGRVCVCDEPIPEDWTYFEVLFADVNFVAVSPVAGDLEELQEKHRAAARKQKNSQRGNDD